jgi:hypothetical protein
MDSHLKVITELKPLQHITSNLICIRHFRWCERKKRENVKRSERNFLVSRSFSTGMTGRGEENVAFESRAL